MQEKREMDAAGRFLLRGERNKIVERGGDRQGILEKKKTKKELWGQGVLTKFSESAIKRRRPIRMDNKGRGRGEVRISPN